jgi:hypothetical protein
LRLIEPTMAVSDDLNRLGERLESGELTPGQYAEEKHRLQEVSIARRQSVLAEMGEARRWRFDLVRGTVRDVAFPSGPKQALVDVDGRKIELTLSEGSIPISVGDDIVAVCRLRPPSATTIYYNETTRSGSLDSYRKTAGQLLKLGWLVLLAAIAIVITVALAAFRGPAVFSISAFFDVPIYLLSIAGSGIIMLLAIGFLCAGTYMRKMSALLQSVVSGRS